MVRRLHRAGPAGIVGVLFLLSSGVVAAPGESLPSTPPWMKAGLERTLADLWIDELDAVAETPEPIDHGDRWAWAGDNAKLLSVVSETDLVHGLEAFEMRAFVEDMIEGPILFQRWANTYEPVIIQDTVDSAELSNHLLTLRVDKHTARVSLEFEYHDGRDKRMVEFGPAKPRIDGTWLPAPANSTRVEVLSGEGFVEVRMRRDGLQGYEAFRLDKHPGMLHEFRATLGDGATGLRFSMVGMEVVSTDRVQDAGHYREVFLEGVGSREPSKAGGATGPFDWMLFLDRGTTDEFANGLLVAPRSGSPIARLADVALRDGDAGAFREVSLEYVGEGDFEWGQRIVPLVGLVTAKPELYGAIATDIEADKYVGKDLSLSYEYSETVLGLLHFANATDDEAAVQRAQTMLEHYAAFYKRGTQTRSLASGVKAALLFHEVSGDKKWLNLSRQMATDLRAYQVQDKSKPEFGSVINEPKGGPFLDSTILAARAWHEMFQRTRETKFRDWSDQAWNSLATEGERVFVKGDEADDNHWSFKSGLILQGAPHLREDLRWAGRNHLWIVLRELDSMQFRTSRFSSETNSETEAWALLGLLRDYNTREGPWILDSEGAVLPLSERGEVPVRLQAPWVGAYLWIEKGWTAVDAAGVPEPKSPGPFDSWRYTASGPVVALHPIEPRPLEEGWTAIGFPSQAGPAPPDRFLNNLPIEIAWTIDVPSGEWKFWRPNDTASTMRTLQPGQGVLILLRKDATLEMPLADARPLPLRPGWNLAIPPPKTNTEWWRVVDRESDPYPVAGARAGPFSARFFGVDVDIEPPMPPMLVAGRIEQDFVHRLRGGLVEARVDGELVSQTRLGNNGSYLMVVHAPTGTKDIELIHYDPAEEVTERMRIDYAPGAYVQPRLGSEGAQTKGPGGLVIFLILLAAFVAVVTLALTFRNGIIGSDSAQDPTPDRPRTRTSLPAPAVRGEDSLQGRP